MGRIVHGQKDSLGGGFGAIKSPIKDLAPPSQQLQIVKEKEIVYVDKPVYIDRIVDNTVFKDRPVYIETVVEKPVEIIIEKIKEVPVYQDVYVDKLVEKVVEKPYIPFWIKGIMAAQLLLIIIKFIF